MNYWRIIESLVGLFSDKPMKIPNIEMIIMNSALQGASYKGN